MKITFNGRFARRDDDAGEYTVVDSDILMRFKLVDGEVVDLCEGLNDTQAAAKLVADENAAAALIRLNTVGARKITKLAFRNRFTTAEKVTIEMAGIDDPAKTIQERTLAANLRVSQSDLQAASFIDLDRPDTRAGVQMLETFGIIGVGRALIILDTPVTEAERYVA